MEAASRGTGWGGAAELRPGATRRHAPADFIESRATRGLVNRSAVAAAGLQDLSLLREAASSHGGAGFVGSAASWFSRLAYLALAGQAPLLPPFAMVDGPWQELWWSRPRGELCTQRQQQQPAATPAVTRAVASRKPPRVPPLPAPKEGYCGVTTTTSQQACESEPWGSFPLRSLGECVRACLGCARCSYLSFSRVNADCSWFYTCDLTRLHTRFAAQAGYQTFDLTAGFEAFGKFPTRKDPYAAVPWRRAAPPPADGRWPALPPTLSDTVELSVLMQYWAARLRTVDFASNAKQFLEQLTLCALASGLTFEVLVNSDSRHVRGGDAATLVRALGPSGFLVLSPNLGETRAYNMLARLARGHLLLFVQDDWRMAPGCGWLSAALQLWPLWEEGVRRSGGEHVGLGLLGFDEGVRGMACRTDGPTVQDETQTPTCHILGEPPTGPDAARGAASTAQDVARARNVQPVPCATMGPLMLPRALFAALGGFNESLSRRGAPSSLLDCELSARVWAAGRAVVTTAWGARPFWPRERSVAWKARGFGRADHGRCLFVSALFRALDRHIARALRRVHAQLGCDGLAPGRWAAAQP